MKRRPTKSPNERKERGARTVFFSRGMLAWVSECAASVVGWFPCAREREGREGLCEGLLREGICEGLRSEGLPVYYCLLSSTRVYDHVRTLSPDARSLAC